MQNRRTTQLIKADLDHQTRDLVELKVANHPAISTPHKD